MKLIWTDLFVLVFTYETEEKTLKYVKLGLTHPRFIQGK